MATLFVREINSCSTRPSRTGWWGNLQTVTNLPEMMLMHWLKQESFCDAAFAESTVMYRSGTILTLTEMLAAFYFIMLLSEEERHVDGSAQGSAVGNWELQTEAHCSGDHHGRHQRFVLVEHTFYWIFQDRDIRIALIYITTYFNNPPYYLIGPNFTLLIADPLPKDFLSLACF